MRVIPMLVAGALALPVCAGSTPPETILPATPEQIVETATRTGQADGAIQSVDEIADDPPAKEHNDQADEPDGPPCGDGG